MRASIVSVLLLTACSSSGAIYLEPAEAMLPASGVGSRDAAPEIDAGVGSRDAAPPVPKTNDASEAALPDERPCVTAIIAPTSPNWIIWVRYEPSPDSSQVRPYLCPGPADGISCAYSLTGGEQEVRLAPGECRKAVPFRCRPCAGVTDW
jgi:hypothetical protein